jgi:ubiquinone/menaquinone biosynthesis C-methylase UbiE
MLPHRLWGGPQCLDGAPGLLRSSNPGECANSSRALRSPSIGIAPVRYTPVMPTSQAFAGSVPRTYHAFLGPLIFEAYARDTAARLAPKAGERVLELACGTGIVTREILAAIGRAGGDGPFTATDLSQGMIDVALQEMGGGTGSGTDPRLKFQAADACGLPFADKSFDAVACQFGVMFFPDKEKAMREARRVLAPGGRLVFNVWDGLAANPIPRVVHEAATAAATPGPTLFLARGPYGYADVREIERATRAGGFTNVEVTKVQFPCVAQAAEDAARGFLEGTPLGAELAQRGIADIAPLREHAAKALAEEFGDRPCRSTMRAIVVTAS